MPKYTVTCRGGLQFKSGLKPTGAVVELSEKDAASLPPGTVEPVAEAAPKPEEQKPSKEKKS